MISSSRVFLLIFLAFKLSAAVPVVPQDAEEEDDDGDDDTGLFYNDYLLKVMKALETDPDFRDQILKYEFEEIKEGKVKINLDKITDEMRLHLDDVKRKEVERIRHLIRAQKDLENGNKLSKTRMKEFLDDIAGHLDHQSPHAFSEEDVIKLISVAAKDMDNYDEDRHERFKKYEMHMKMKEEERLAGMTAEERDEEYKKMKEQRKKHNDHDPVNHPGSRKQFEEVWNEEDEMTDEDFDPKTFFMLHDKNSDKFLDVYEVELLMEHELKKVYDVENEEDDMIEMEEERLRMREHFFKEVDKNNDKMVSLHEFMDYTKTRDFDKPDMNSYETVDQAIDRGHVFSKEDLAEYKKMIDEQERLLKEKIEQMRVFSKGVMEEKKEIAKTKLEQHKQPGSNPAMDALIKQREDEIDARQKILQDMAEEVQSMAKDLSSMKNDYASNMLNSEEYQQKISDMETQQQEKLVEAERKLQDLMNDEKAQAKLADFEKKKKEMEEKFEQLKHQL